MAIGNDGDIKLGVRLEPKDIKKSAEDVAKQVNSVFAAAEGKQTTASLKRMLTTLDKLSSKSKRLTQDLNKMETKNIQTTEFKALGNEMAKYNRQMKELAVRRQLLEQQLNETSDAKEKNRLKTRLQNLETYYAERDKLYKQAQAKRAEMLVNGTSHKNEVDTKQYAILKDSLNDVTNRQRVAIEALSEYIEKNSQSIDPELYKSIQEALGKTDSSLKKLSEDSDKMGNNLKKVFADNLTGKAGELVRSFSKLKGLSKTQIAIALTAKAVSKLGKELHKLTKEKIENAKKKLQDFFEKFKQHAKSSQFSLKKGFKWLMMYGLGMRSLYMLIRKIRAGVREGLKNLSEFRNGMNDTNYAIVDMQSSLLYLKNAIAAAFAPILNVALPLLSRLMDALAQVSNMIASFFASFTGSATFIKATKVQLGYTKALNGSAKAMKQLSNNLAGFDDLDVLQQDKDNDGGGAGAGGIDPNKMFEFADVPTSVENLVARIKEAFENADFTEIGNTLGLKLKEALDSIPWDEIKETSYNIGKSIATFINGFFETDELSISVGTAIGESINTAIKLADGLIHNLHFDSLGTFIGESIRTAILTVDWELAGRTLVDGFNGVIEMVTTALNTEGLDISINKIINGIYVAVESIDWDKIADLIIVGIHIVAGSVGSFFDKINIKDQTKKMMASVNKIIKETDWKEVGKALSDWLKALPTFISTVFKEIDWTQVDLAIKEFFDGFDLTGYLASKISASSSKWIAIVVLIIKIILGAITELQVELLVKVFEVGVNIVKGLVEGVTSILVNAYTWISEKIDEIITWVKELFGIHSPSTVFAEIGEFLIEGLILGIESLLSGLLAIFTKIKDKVVAKTQEMVTAVIEKYNKLKERVIYHVEMLKLKVHTLFMLLSKLVQDAVKIMKEKVVEKYNNMKEKVLEIVTNLKQGISDKFTSIKNKVTEIVTKIKDGVHEKWEKLKDNAIETFDTMKTKIVEIMHKLSDLIKKPINAIIGGVEKMSNGLITGINKMISALNSLSFSIPDWVPELGGKSFGLSIPTIPNISIPRLAKGGVIPPNNEFLAVLGDQKHGTNIEAPLDTIVQAFEQVVGNMHVENTGYSEMTLDGQTFARLITPYVISELDRQGYNVEVLEA